MRNPVNESHVNESNDIPTHVPDPNGNVSMAVFGLVIALLLILIIAIALAA
ncbi:MAG TPA: hypothetical protein VKZ61_07125 [Thermomicrobiales bacterium]|nr:hypothetical protein [Thermomicrobiales bacterium]